MDRSQNAIEGVLLTPLRQIADERGAVLHMLRSDSEGYVGFGECYFSEVVPGAVKAWKCHLRQTQNLSAPVGRLRLVIVDLRTNSSTQGHVMDLELSRPHNYLRVTIPPNLWYGFSCLSEQPALLVNCADLPHDACESIARSPSDPQFPQIWAARHQPQGHDQI